MWRELTESDVLGVLSAQETHAYQYAGSQAGQDVLATILASVVQNCRAFIADHPQNRLAPGNTLPERCHLPALHIVRHELLTRLDQSISEDRRKDVDRAHKFFERVAEGRVSIERPDGTDTATTSEPTIQTLSRHERQATRDNLRGL